MDTWSQVVVKILCINTFSFLLTTPRNSSLASIFSKLSWNFCSTRFQSPNPIKHIDVCQIKAAAGNRFMDVSDLLSICICNELIASIAIGWWLIPNWTSQYFCWQIYNWAWCCLSLNSRVWMNMGHQKNETNVVLLTFISQNRSLGMRDHNAEWEKLEDKRLLIEL